MLANTRGMHVAHRTLQGGRVLIQDGIELGMADVGVLRVERVATFGLLRPWQLGVGTAPGDPIVANPQNDLLLADDACAHLPTT